MPDNEQDLISSAQPTIVPSGDEIIEKAGRVLSSQNAQAIMDAFNATAGATNKLMELLKRAGIEQIAEEAPAEGEEVESDDAPPAEDAPVEEDADTEEKMVVRPSQKEVNYTPVSTKKGEACSNCRWFSANGMYGDGGAYCHLITNYPDDIVPNGYCDRHEAIPTVDPTENPLPVVIVESKAQPEGGYIAPDSNADNIFKVLAQQFKKGLKPGDYILKANGKRHMLIVTSNSYRDRTRDWLTSSALKEYVDKCWKGEDVFYNDNPLLYWHDPRVKIGDIVWSDMRGPFLAELAIEANNPIAKSIFDYREAHPEEKWGASHRFKPLLTDTSGERTFHRILKKETSILPRFVAANSLTYSGVLPMADKRGEYLNKMLKLPNAAELLDKGIEVLIAELAKAGDEHKSTDVVDKTTDLQKDFGTMLVSMIDAQYDAVEKQEAADVTIKQQADEIKVLKDARTADADVLKAANDAIAALRTDLDNLTQKTLGAAPRRASADPRTALTDEQAAAVEKEIPRDIDPFWSNLGVKKDA